LFNARYLVEVELVFKCHHGDRGKMTV
jgi:hypothetical protein